MVSNGCNGNCLLAPSLFYTPKYSKVYKGLGIAQVVLGSFSLEIGCALLVVAGQTYDYAGGITWFATGIWCGVFILIDGILGIKSASTPSQCIITAALVMTIFGALASAAMCGLEATSAVLSFRDQYPKDSNQIAQFAMHCTLAVIGFIGLVISVVHSAYCCCAKCCTNQPTSQTLNSSIVSQGQVVTTPHHQGQCACGPRQYSIMQQGITNPSYIQKVVLVNEAGIPVQGLSNHPIMQTGNQAGCCHQHCPASVNQYVPPTGNSGGENHGYSENSQNKE